MSADNKAIYEPCKYVDKLLIISVYL